MSAEKTFLPEIENLLDHRKDDHGSSTKQVFAAFIANIGAINTGMMMGFSAVTIPQLKSESSALHMTKEQLSWFASLGSVGTPFGCLLSAYLTDVVGRKRILIYTEIPAILGWTTIAISQSVEWIYIGRILTGISAGMIGAPSRVYTAEVTQPHLRGILAALASVGVSFGVTLEYIVGSFYEWRELAWISSIIPLVAICGSIFCLPESPTWLVSSGQKEKCVDSLKKLRDSTFDVEHEANILIKFSERQQTTTRLSMRKQLKIFGKTSVLKPFFILVSYFAIYQMSGCSSTTFYAVTIFEDFGITKNKYFLTSLTGIIRLLSTILGCYLMRYCRRRTLTFISAVGCGITMYILGLYGSLIFKFNMDYLEEYSWLPTLSIFLFTVSSTVGYLIIPWVMIGELYPAKIRGLAGGLTTASSYIAAFLTVKTFPLFRDIQPLIAPYFLYGTISLLGFLFFYIFLPETKDKSLQEIEEKFSTRVNLEKHVKKDNFIRPF